MVGALRKRIQVQTKTATRNGYGEEVYTWATTTTRWGRIDNRTGREKWSANTKYAEVDAVITMRYYALTAEQRLLCGADYYDITAVLPDERKAYMTVLATKTEFCS